MLCHVVIPPVHVPAANNPTCPSDLGAAAFEPAPARATVHAAETRREPTAPTHSGSMIVKSSRADVDRCQSKSGRRHRTCSSGLGANRDRRADAFPGAVKFRFAPGQADAWFEQCIALADAAGGPSSARESRRRACVARTHARFGTESAFLPAAESRLWFRSQFKSTR
jgi:hypothetical protein